MMLTRTLLALAAITVCAPAAEAQIYMARDANGTVVLSDRRLDAPTRIYEVPGAPTYRATRPAAQASSRGDRFEPLVREHAARHALRPELVRAVIQVESGFNPGAVSPKGAMGLMQLMPATARDLGVRNPFDPSENIGGGARYLRQLLDKYRGNEELALAAYNAGSGAVDRYGRKVPPYRETREYVRKVDSVAGSLTSASAPAVVQASRPRRTTYYKFYEIVDGRIIPKYSNQRPASGSYELVEL